SNSLGSPSQRHKPDGLSVDAVAEIESLQTYHYGSKFRSAPIRVLDDFCNINQHRRILVTVLAVHLSHTEFTSTLSGRTTQSTLSPRYHDAEIAVSPLPAALGEEMEMEGGALFYITFDEGAAKGIEVATCLNSFWRLLDG